MNLPKKLALLGFSVMLGAGACKTTGSLSAAKVSYAETAKTNFEAGASKLSNGQYEEAHAFFDFVRTKYPYSPYAALSDLLVADAYFDEEKFIESADAYDFFLRFHPNHEKSAHAYFRIAQSHYKAMPSNFFIFPPRHVKDLTAAKMALLATNEFLSRYPKHKNAAKAHDLKESLITEFSKADFAVAEFYQKRKKWIGAFARYQRVFTLYPKSLLAPKALVQAASIAKEKMEELEQSKQLYKQILVEYPKSKFVEQAEKALNDLVAG